MSDIHQRPAARHSALLVRSYSFSLIWIIPIVAAVTAAWLGLDSLNNRGTAITIEFENASGIQPGITKIKHKDAVIGTVETIKLTPNLSRVVAIARIEKIAEPYLTKGARFWVVKPSISSRDLSGLGTLISGPYIEFQPSKTDSDKESTSRHFSGEQSPAIMPTDEPGEVFTLHAPQLGSIQQGTPVNFRGIKVGEVLGYVLSDKDGSADVQVFVHAPHTSLIHKNTRFWNTSGILVMVGSGGLKLQLESVQSLLTGGLAFGVPANTEAGPEASPDTMFTLYPDEASAEDSIYTKRIRFLLHFADPVSGLTKGSAVRMHGLSIGQVISVNIDYDGLGHLNAEAVIEIESERIQLQQGNKTSTAFEGDGYELIRKLVASGLRARVGSGNLLTGQNIVELNLAQGAPVTTIIEGGAYPEIPTVEANNMDSILRSAKNTLNSANTLINHADKAISEDEDGGDLAGTLREFKDTARSVRVLTDYLEAHPEAIIRGKPKDDQP